MAPTRSSKTATPPSVKIQVVIERKHADMPAFVVVPAAKVARWKLPGTTTVEGTLDGIALGRRSLQRWDEERWFIELRRGLLEEAGKRPGDRAILVLHLASIELPAELQHLIDTERRAREQWEIRTDAQRRMLREYVLSAKAPATRERRARRALLPVARPRAPKIAGLRSDPQTILVMPCRFAHPYFHLRSPGGAPEHRRRARP